MRLSLVIAACFALAASFAGASSASAATTIYPVGFFNNAGVANPNRLLGNNPNVNNIARNNSIGLRFADDITKFTLSFVVTSVSSSTTWLWVRVGNRTGTTFTSATASGLTDPNGGATQNLYVQITGPGTYWINTVVYDAGCQSIGGCNAFLFGNSSFSQAGSTFGLSVVGATPEPSVWALMILAFIGVAARLKQTRARTEPAV